MPVPDAPPVSLDDAISHPIYSLTTTASDDDEVEESGKIEADKDAEKGPKRKLQACILCPQRLFKNDKMVEDHVKSKVSQLVLYVLIITPRMQADELNVDFSVM